jgi:hypothetical protein
MSNLTNKIGITKMKYYLSALIIWSITNSTWGEVREQDLIAWVGVPVGALNNHPIFNNFPMNRRFHPHGVETRNYVNSGPSGVCNNIFYIKDQIVVAYAPLGNCFTDNRAQP